MVQQILDYDKMIFTQEFSMPGAGVVQELILYIIQVVMAVERKVLMVFRLIMLLLEKKEHKLMAELQHHGGGMYLVLDNFLVGVRGQVGMIQEGEVGVATMEVVEHMKLVEGVDQDIFIQCSIAPNCL